MKKISVVIVAFLICFHSIPAQSKVRAKGLGLLLGVPLGVTGKLWFGPNDTIDFGIGFIGSNLQVHLDYLYHVPNMIKIGERTHLTTFFGAGGRVRGETGFNKFGVRFPIGVAYFFGDKSQYEIGAEVVPILDIAPDWDFAFNGAAFARLYF